MRPIDQLTAADIMSRTLISARPDQPLKEVERILIEQRIGGMPVVDAGRLVGIVSRSDIARVQVLMLALDEQVSDALQWDDTQADGFQHTVDPDFSGFRQRIDLLKVREAMRDQVVTCTPQAPVSEIAARMLERHIHRLVVVEDQKPVGIISSLDLVKLLRQGK